MITKEDFMDYEAVRVSGVTNMWDIKLACELSGLDKDKVIVIMADYSTLKKQFIKSEGEE